MRTQALFGMITVVLRAATLILQSLVIGGLVYRRWIAAGETTAAHERPYGVLLLRIAAMALAATQILYLSLNTMIALCSRKVGKS